MFKKKKEKKESKISHLEMERCVSRTVNAKMVELFIKVVKYYYLFSITTK